MNVYTIYADVKEGIDARTFVANVDDIETEHVGFNQWVDVETIQHFLYRDYPD